MRIVLDENMPSAVASMLRSCGHDVAWIRTDSPGATDEAILARAVSEQRLLITFDKDFGDLAFRQGHAASCGVLLFRIATPSAAAVAKKITDMVNSRNDWIGWFSVIDDRRIRMTPLPASPPRHPR